MPEIQKLYERAQRLSNKYGIREHTLSFFKLTEKTYRQEYTEHTIHELAHAKVLKMNLDRVADFVVKMQAQAREWRALSTAGVTTEVGQRLRRTRRIDIQMASERRTWSVEFNVLLALPCLGFGEDFAKDRLFDLGFPGKDIDKMFSEIKRPWAQRYAQEILALFELYDSIKAMVAANDTVYQDQ